MSGTTTMNAVGVGGERAGSWGGGGCFLPLDAGCRATPLVVSSCSSAGTTRAGGVLVARRLVIIYAK